MSVCTFIASDFPLAEVTPSKEYPLEINIDNAAIFDGDAEDNYFLYHFTDVADYTDKKYGVVLEWNYTVGRGKQIVEYIKNALHKTDTIEFWHVWMMDYCEFEDRPFIHRKTITVNELTAECIKEIIEAQIWNTPDKMYPDRPSFYCLTVTR